MMDLVIYHRCIDGGPQDQSLPRYVGFWTETRTIPKKGIRTDILPLRFEGDSEEEIRAKAEAQYKADVARLGRQEQTNAERLERLAKARAKKMEATDA